MLISSFGSLGAVWITLLLGFHLWALPVGSLVNTGVLLILFFQLEPKIWQQLHNRCVKRSIPWGGQIAKLQGKYAITILGGYFTSSLLVPTLYKMEGAVIAAQMGLTISLASALATLSLSWANSKFPQFNVLVANNQRKELHKLVRQGIIIGGFIYTAGAIVFVIFIHILNNKYEFFNGRFLNLNQLILVFLYHLVMPLAGPLSNFFRAHKTEPHVKLAVFQGGIIALAVFVVIPLYGLPGMLVALNFVYWFIVFPWILGIYLSYIKKFG